MKSNSLSFVAIPPGFLRSIATGNIQTPSLYYHSNFLLREIFWLRLRVINFQMSRLGLKGGRCLDFGGGSGVFLPTLSQRFDQVSCIDLDVSEAKAIAEKYQIQKVAVVESDISNADYSSAPFDAIVAADVLEHFQDLTLPVTAIRQWLSPGGYLFTSLPTENWVYVLLRKFFGIEKPFDHYHTGVEVETFLRRSGFVPQMRIHLPLFIPFATLFLVTAWRRA